MDKEKLSQVLTKSPIFKGVGNAEIQNLLMGIKYSLRSFSKGQMVAQSGELCDSLIIVVSGSVKGEMVDYSGKVIKIEDIDAPRPVASAFIFGKQNRYPVNVVATKTSTLIYIPKASFLYIMQKNEILLKNYLNAISNRTQFLTERISFLSFNTIKGKIAHYLRSLSSDEKNRKILPKSQTELAEFFGVARPSFSRSLSEMEKEGMIKINKKEITILNQELLNQQL